MSRHCVVVIVIIVLTGDARILTLSSTL